MSKAKYGVFRAWLAIFLVAGLLAVAFLHSNSEKQPNSVWVGIGYVYAKYSKNATAEGGAAIGVLGVIDSAIWGFALGGVAGVAAGL